MGLIFSCMNTKVSPKPCFESRLTVRTEVIDPELSKKVAERQTTPYVRRLSGVKSEERRRMARESSKNRL